MALPISRILRSHLQDSAAAVRLACRRGEWTEPTSGLAQGCEQANLVILPQAWAEELVEFCQLNPKPCPLLEVTAPGQFEPRQMAPGADLRTDLPRYRIFRGGMVSEASDLLEVWREDLVSVLLGCSFTFEAALAAAGLPLRHQEQGCNVPMYRTSVACKPAGRLAGPLVVSMRPMTPRQARRAAEVTAAFPHAHGAPVQIDEAAILGIADLARPDFGDPVEIRPDEVPVFWACGVTPQEALARARPEFAIAHAPGCMLVCDRR